MKRLAVFLSVLAICGGTGMAGCGEGKTGEYPAYESVADRPADAEYAFESELEGEKSPYPLSAGRVFYVSAEGSSANDGLSEAAPLDLAAVNSQAFQAQLTAGDSILFRRGDTFGNLTITDVSGSEDNPVTLSAYGEGEAPFFRYSGNPVVIAYCGNFVVRDLKIEVVGVDRAPSNPSQRAGLSLVYDHPGDRKFENIYIFDNEIFSESVQKNTFGIEVTAASQNWDSRPVGVLKNVHIKRNTVHDLGRSGIHTIGWLVDEGYNNVDPAMYEDIFIDENVVYNIGCMGIYITCCTNSTINRNLVYSAGIYDKAELMEGECGIMALCADGMDIMYNEIYGCRDQEVNFDAMGIDIDWNCTDINVQYNYCYANQGGGIGTMSNRDSFIRNNRIENNLCDTNHEGQITVTGFTSRVAGVPEDMHVVKNLQITDNLIVGTPSGKYMFYCIQSNGDAAWSGNVFAENRVVYTGEDPMDICFVSVEETVPWYKFAGNRYYSADTSTFKCIDGTVQADIDPGASAYGGRSLKFENWQKRDVGSVYERTSAAPPSAPSAPEVRFENGRAEISWKGSDGDVWHYNVYVTGDGEDAEYRNMLGETEGTSWTFEPEHTGVYNFIVQPESNQGVYGRALKIRVEIK